MHRNIIYYRFVLLALLGVIAACQQEYSEPTPSEFSKTSADSIAPFEASMAKAYYTALLEKETGGYANGNDAYSKEAVAQNEAV